MLLTRAERVLVVAIRFFGLLILLDYFICPVVLLNRGHLGILCRLLLMNVVNLESLLLGKQA